MTHPIDGRRRAQPPTDQVALPDDDAAVSVDLAAIAGLDEQRGVLWSQETADLDVNVVAFPAGAGVGEHVNAEVDVLLVVIAGQGRAEVAGRVHSLVAGAALVVPKGVSRSIHCTAGRLVYLTCHRRRVGLMPAYAARS